MFRPGGRSPSCAASGVDCRYLCRSQAESPLGDPRVPSPPPSHGGRSSSSSEPTARSDRRLALAPVLASHPVAESARPSGPPTLPPAATARGGTACGPIGGDTWEIGTCSCLAGDSNPAVRAGDRCGRSTQLIRSGPRGKAQAQACTIPKVFRLLAVDSHLPPACADLATPGGGPHPAVIDRRR